VGLARIAAAGYPIEGGDDIGVAFLSLKLRNVILYDAAANLPAGRFDLLEQLDRVLAVDSGDVDALVLRGEAERLMTPRSAASFQWYEKALKREPGNLAALRALGYAHHAVGDNEKAAEYLRKYCELAGDAPDIMMAREVLRKCGG
jgi:tetratricopeptide (TPR) repeat protein